jgi:hypothetical protein
MDKSRRVMLALLVAILFAFGIFLGHYVTRLLASNSAPRIYSTPVILQQVQTLSELVTVSYVMEKVQILEVPSENMIGQAIGSRNRVLLLAHGVVKAGIDLKQLQPADLSVTGTTVTVKLPPARITDAYLDEKQTKVIDRSTGLLAPSDKDLEQTARQHAVDDIRNAAGRNGILIDAEERARKQLAALFLQLGFKEVEFHLQRRATPLKVTLTAPETSETPKR